MSSSSSIGSSPEPTDRSPQLDDALNQFYESEDRFVGSFSSGQLESLGHSFIQNIRPEQLPILQDVADKFNAYKALDKAVEELKAAEVEFERKNQELERRQQKMEELKRRLAQPAPEQSSSESISAAFPPLLQSEEVLAELKRRLTEASVTPSRSTPADTAQPSPSNRSDTME